MLGSYIVPIVLNGLYLVLCSRTNKTAMPLTYKPIDPNSVINQQYQGGPTRYLSSSLDPILDPKEKEERSSVNGYIRSHKNINELVQKNTTDFFGDVSFLSLNSYPTKDLVEHDQGLYILKLIDTHHPTVFAIQSIGKTALDTVIDGIDINGNKSQKKKTHYSITGNDQDTYLLDIEKNKHLSLPILYDSKILELVNQGVFTPKTQKNSLMYARFAVFRDKRKMVQKNGVLISDSIFTVINMDLYSSNEKHIESQFRNINTHLLASNHLNGPVFFLGSINGTTKELDNIINKSKDIQNLVEIDENNRELSKSTFHNHNKIHDEKQRDYILYHSGSYKDTNFKMNYTRILSEANTEFFEHYPIYSINSYLKKIDYPSKDVKKHTV